MSELTPELKQQYLDLAAFHELASQDALRCYERSQAERQKYLRLLGMIGMEAA